MQNLTVNEKKVQSRLYLTQYIESEEFQKIQNEFSIITGVSIIFIDEDGKNFTHRTSQNPYCQAIKKYPKYKESCDSCDLVGSHVSSKPKIYLCHRNFVNFSFPIIIDGYIAGYMFCGQVNYEDSCHKIEYLDGFEYDGVEPDELASHRGNIKEFDYKQIQATINILSNFVEKKIHLELSKYENEVLLNKLSQTEMIVGSQSYEIFLDTGNVWLSQQTAKRFFADPPRSGVVISEQDYKNKCLDICIYQDGEIKDIADYNYDIVSVLGINLEDDISLLKENYTLEYFYKDNENKIYRTTVHVRGDGKRVISLIGAVIDITYDKIREKKLESAYNKLNKAESILKSYSIDYNMSTQEIWCSKNSPTCRILGLDHDHTLSFSDYANICAKSAVVLTFEGRVIKSLEDYMDVLVPKGGNLSQVVNYEIVANGITQNIRAHIKCTKKDGEFETMFATCIDVTEQLAKEQEILSIHDKLNLAEEISKVGSWEYDVKKQTIWNSKYYSRMRNLPSSGESTRNIKDLVANLSNYDVGVIKKDNKEVKTLEGALSLLQGENKISDEVHNIEYELVFPDHVIDLISAVKAKYSDDNELLKLNVTSRDITAEKNKEKELIIAKERAEEATAQQSRFVANMSHEIRTPLNAILGFAEILQEQNKDDKLNHYLRSINVAGKSLLSLVNDILDYSKVKANKYKANYVPSLVSDICEELEILFHQSIDQKDLVFDIIYQANLPTFNLPRATIRQILVNLVGNAVKFTNKGSIEVAVEVIERSAQIYDINFSVTDTGIGIGPEKLDLVFNEFEQADLSHEKSGTGLGLALSLNFAKLINGDITVESEVGKGSKFNLKLNDVRSADNAVQALYQATKDEHYTFLKQKVLILDHSLDSREILTCHCERMNLEVRSFKLGVDALANLEGYNPDLVLTDLKMCSMDGDDFADNVRAISKFSDLPIICITTNISPADDHNIENFNEVLHKPIGSNQLAMVFAKYLDYEINHLKDDSIKKEPSLNKIFSEKLMDSATYGEIKKTYHDEIKHLCKAMNLTKIKELALSLQKLENQSLVAFGEKIYGYCNALDIGNVRKSIKDLLDIFESRG